MFEQKIETGMPLKAAMIVRLLQNEGADLKLDSLPEETQVRLTRALSRMKPVDRGTLDSVASEFSQQLESLALTAPGGMHGALAAMEGKLSPGASARLVDEAGAGDPTHAWRKINALPLENQSRILAEEGVEVCALLLSKLPVARAAELLSTVSGPRARAIARITARIDDLPSGTAGRIAHALVAEYCDTPAPLFDVDAVHRVANMLNATRRDLREEILTGLEEDDPEFAKKVRAAIFVFANIYQRVAPLDAPKVMRLLNPEQVTTCLGGALEAGGEDAKSAEFLLENMSKRMSEQVRDEIASAGRFRSSDVEEAQAMLIQSIRDAADGGEIILMSPDDGETT